MPRDEPSNDNEDRKPGLGGRQGQNELQPKKRPRRLSSEHRTRPAGHDAGEPDKRRRHDHED